MRPVIILFAKAPIPGSVKTRLVPPLTASEAAELHDGFVCGTIERLRTLGGFDLELHTDIETGRWTEYGLPRALQTEGDLGLRMFRALESGLERGHPRAMIVGSDAPTLPLAHLELLLQSAKDVALGPTEDGGFYAIACRRVDARMFDGVPWSAPDTLAATVDAARRCGLSVELGELWFDVDTPADLERLRAGKT